MKQDNEKTRRLELRVSPEFIKRLDNWRQKQVVLPSRGEAIRIIVIKEVTG